MIFADPVAYNYVLYVTGATLTYCISLNNCKCNCNCNYSCNGNSAIIAIILIGSDRPTPRDINNYGIRNGVASDWHSLGVQLIPDDLQGYLNIIKINNPTDAIQCTTEMFNYWLQVDTTASWNKLIEALKKINKYQLAQTICEKVLQGNSTYI